ncbi:MAG: stage II sporulation protein P [Firmicutes bacterium]|nr:stage II sporulation protein P [Bacillota bacterium]
MKKILSFVTILSFVFCLTVNVSGESELGGGKYTTMKDESGRVITRTAHPMVSGDRYLDSENKLYQVTRVKGNTAIAKPVKSGSSPWDTFRKFFSGVFNPNNFRAEVKAKGPIGIYHTHSDESYLPSDGVSSREGNGGIFQVGETLANGFEAAGIPVAYSKTPHDPHDAMSYDRSRRTAAQLLKKSPICLLDVHRDAVPREEYTTVINSRPVTKVQLVVGRQNPNFQANNNFAQQIKAVVDQKYPGLIKGIFYGKGKYNQDLGPRALLLEFGANTNSKEAAERSAWIFASAAKEVVYGNVGNRLVNRGSLRSLFWILAALVGGVGLFLLINKRGLKNIREFTGAVGETGPEDEKKQDGQNPGPGDNGQ